MSLIRTRQLTLRHGPLKVLENVDFQIDRGEIVTLIGPNGSGKSSLIRALLGVLKPAGGAIERAPGLVVGYVPQQLSIDATLPMTVARFLSLPKHKTAAEIARVTQRVGAPGLEARQMVDLSGGQFQRILLARALLMAPDILILDEPTQGLDQPGILSFYGLIEEVRRDLGCAVLLVSHDLHIVMGATDRVVCLNGHVCCQGTPDAVTETPEYRALFGAEGAGALAMYRHHHDHSHDHGHNHNHENDSLPEVDAHD
jgi:zinc transport system ATP-binding protein